MRTRSQSREPRPPPPEGTPVVIEPLRIEYPFQEDPDEDQGRTLRTMAQLLQATPTEDACHTMDSQELPSTLIQFYKLNINDQDSLTRSSGNFLDTILARNSTNSHPIGLHLSVAELKDIVRALLLDKKNQASAPSPAPAPVKASHGALDLGSTRFLKNMISMKNEGTAEVFEGTEEVHEGTAQDETYDMLHDLIVGLENKLRHKVKTIRCDHGTEFKNQLMNEFCAKKGIKREYSIARTPQQNGVAERKNRTLIEAARTMLADSLLPIQFWAEAVNTACYVVAFAYVILSLLLEDNLCAYDCYVNIMCTGRSLGAYNLEVATPRALAQQLGFFKPTSSPTLQLTFSYNNMDPTIDVTSTPTLRIHKIHPQSQIIGKSIAGVQRRRKLKDSTSNQHQALLSFIYKQNRTNHKDQQTCLFACFLSHRNQDRSLNALAMKVGLKRCKKICFYSRLQRGVDYDEVFAPVARIEAIRLFLAFASFMGFTVYQMDVKSAFLYGNITEEVYVKQPPGFEDPSHPNKVYRVVKALYGLHQAPRAWFVDDIIFGSTKSSMVKDFEDLMQKEFKMSSMGELTFFLGLQVKQTSAGIFLSQDKYVKDILNKFGTFRTIMPSILPHEAQKSLEIDDRTDHNVCCLLYARFQSHSNGFLILHAVNNVYLVDPDPKFGPWLQQFWATASLRVINDVPHIRAVVAGKKILISEETIRADLLFDDAHGVDCFPKQVIWDVLRDIGYEGTDTSQKTAEVPGTANSQGTAEVQGTADFQGDEGLLDLYALNREVRRLKKQTLSQAKLIRKLKAKLKNLSKVVAPVVKHHAFWVESQHLAKQKRRRKKQKKKMSSVKLGRNKEEGTLSEEHYVQDDYTADPFFEDIVDKDAAVTPDIERKSDETEALERKSDETKEILLLLDRVLSLQGPLIFDDEAGPSSPIRPTQNIEPEEQFKVDEGLGGIRMMRRLLKIQAEWDAEEERKSKAYKICIKTQVSNDEGIEVDFNKKTDNPRQIDKNMAWNGNDVQKSRPKSKNNAKV
ncbi:putative ribonuclease H-like domain-containing protein [Tanacetum coccineum]